MAYPDKYTRQFDFQAFQNANPNRPLPGDKVNADLNLAEISIGEIVEFLKTSLRSDGAIMNGAVGYDQLDTTLQSAGLAPLTAWAPSTAYVVSRITINAGSLYVCLFAHTSSAVFTNDFAAGYWEFIAELPSGEDGTDGRDAWLPVVEWLTATAYVAGPPASVVTHGGESYVCLVAHTSGIFATDLAASKWILIAAKGVDGAVAIAGTPTVNQFANWTDATTLKGTSITGLVKGNGSSAPTAAVSNTDYLPVASPVMTGTPAAPTAAADTNTTQLATTAYVIGQAASATPLIDGTAATGTSTRFARADHVHPTDTTRQAADAQLFSNIPQNAQSANYTLVASDAQKCVYHNGTDNNARTFTIPANSSVPYPIGTAITFVNSINTVTIAITTDTLILAGPGTTGSRTLAANGMATALKVGSTVWFISGAGLT